MLHQYLERAAERHPQRPALETAEGVLTYRALRHAARRFARRLHARGVPAGARVVLWLPKAASVYVAVHGVLAAGCAYVPVDIAAPYERVAGIASDSCAQVLVCRGADVERLLPALPACTTLVLSLGPTAAAGDPRVLVWGGAELDAAGSDAPTEREAAHEQLELPRDPEQLAYILYTSGSTGRPKGVALSHRAALAFVDWAAAVVGLCEHDRVSNHASLGFDLSIFDIFASAAAGACLCPVPASPMTNGYVYARFIEQLHISVWYSVPTVLARITEQQERRPLSLSSLRVVIFAGEPFAKADLQRFAAVVPGARLFNWYGPTETNVCTSHEVTARDLQSDEALPIGRPCPYSEIDIAASDTPGHGELFVAGASLLSGYIDAGRVDATVLTRRPGFGELGFYPTGDFVRRAPDGCLAYEGRRDSQIKKNGYRIELREIEEVALHLPGVAETAAVYEAAQIWLFAVCSPDVSDAQLGSHLARKLPSYMLPDRILRLDGMPRNDRGKNDRIALRRIAAGEAS